MQFKKKDSLRERIKGIKKDNTCLLKKRLFKGRDKKDKRDKRDNTCL